MQMKTKMIPVNGINERAYAIVRNSESKTCDYSFLMKTAGAQAQRDVFDIYFRNQMFTFTLLSQPAGTVLTLDNIARVDYKMQARSLEWSGDPEMEKRDFEKLLQADPPQFNFDNFLEWSIVVLLLPNEKIIKESVKVVELPDKSRVKVKVPKGKTLMLEGDEGGPSPMKALTIEEQEFVDRLEASERKDEPVQLNEQQEVKRPSVAVAFVRALEKEEMKKPKKKGITYTYYGPGSAGKRDPLSPLQQARNDVEISMFQAGVYKEAQRRNEILQGELYDTVDEDRKAVLERAIWLKGWLTSEVLKELDDTKNRADRDYIWILEETKQMHQKHWDEDHAIKMAEVVRKKREKEEADKADTAAHIKKAVNEAIAPMAETYNQATLVSTPSHERKWWQNLRAAFMRQSEPADGMKWRAVAHIVVMGANLQIQKPKRDWQSDYLTPRMLVTLINKLRAPGASIAKIEVAYGDMLRRYVTREEQKSVKPAKARA